MMTSRLTTILFLTAFGAFAHCDSLDGPVVEAARRALSSGDVKAVLHWVPPSQEAAIRQAYARALSVRKLGGNAEGLADTWFFETVVRIHRAGEGAPYTGLKPAGSEVAPAIRAADKAIDTGELKPLQSELTAGMQQALRERFQRVQELKNYSTVDAGRRYVAAYVDFIHFAERVEQALGAEGHQH